jgi:hypothetical protein
VGYTSSRDGTNVAVGGDTGPIERTIDENALQAILAGASGGGSRSSRRARRMGSGDSGSGVAAAADIEEVSSPPETILSFAHFERFIAVDADGSHASVNARARGTAEEAGRGEEKGGRGRQTKGRVNFSGFASAGHRYRTLITFPI